MNQGIEKGTDDEELADNHGHGDIPARFLPVPDSIRAGSQPYANPA
jgi:hypothetical protein